jgi:putative redox protein
VSERTVLVASATARWDGEPYRVALSSAGHDAVGDEPPHLGGHNAGPAPFGYLLMGLGSCTVITLRMYAERKSWPLTDVRVSLDYRVDRDGAGRIHRVITLLGDVTDEQRARLLEIAGRTPVTRAIAAGTPIDTTEARP